MHGHRHIDWIGACGAIKIVSAPSPVMGAADDAPSYVTGRSILIEGARIPARSSCTAIIRGIAWWSRLRESVFGPLWRGLEIASKCHKIGLSRAREGAPLLFYDR
jgi:hypothetical protein